MYKKKTLGQHFLKSAHYLRLVAQSARIAKGEAVLEIGPGDGALTEELLARGAHVVAIEKDTRLISVLQEKFKKEISKKSFVLLEGDALECSVSDLPLQKKYKLAANIPYYITGAILKKFLSEKRQPSLAVLLVQKEVAERIARSKKESILSLSVKAYGMPKYIKTVPRGAFAPAPGVDSGILLIEHISRNHFENDAHEETFFKIVRLGFGQKRKFLKRNLESLLGIHTSEALAQAGIAEKARAEDVVLQQWLQLAKRRSTD